MGDSEGALPSWRLLQVLRVEYSGAAAAAYNGVSRTLGPERLLWHGNSDEFRMKKENIDRI